MALYNPTAPFAADYKVAVLGDNPKLYWRLSETSGATAADASGNGNNGTFVASPTLGVTGAILTERASTAVTLNGTTQYITSSYVPFTNATTRTYEAWCIRTNQGSNMSIFSASVNYPATTFLSLRGGGTSVEWYTATAGTVLTSSFPSAPTPWTHVVVIFAEGADTVELYLNGASQGVKAHTDAYDGTPGTFQIANPEGLLTGSIDEVAVYEAALTPGQIRAHYAAAGY